VAATEEILGQFLGDDAFPVRWESDVEKDFFWVYDDLHIPHPVSPMFFDIGGWWLSCDHMFRRFGTPFAVDWLAKNVNGYVYTTAIPADPGLRIEGTEYSSSYVARVPRDEAFAGGMGKYLDTVLPVYGEHFADWWRDRLVPEMQRNFSYLEDRLDHADEATLPELATLLEDAIDIHDRHWKIHWMLNFAQLSATLNLRAVMERIRGEVDEELLGRLQNSASDRNWDSIEALWKMKNEVRDDAELRAPFEKGGGDAAAIAAALQASDRGRRFIAERIEPYQREFGWHAVWSHEFIFPTVREQMEPVLDLIRDYLASDYDYPTAIEAMRRDIEAASEEILAGLSGADLEEMRAANAINLRMAPLTPDHHFYIDQGANAHVRLVLIAIGRKLVEQGRLDQPDDVLFLRYNELRMLIGDPAFDGRPLVAERRAERDAAKKLRPRNWVGTVTPSQLAFPYLVNWGYPDRFYQEQGNDGGPITGIGGSPGVIEGTARVVMTIDEFDEVTDGDILVCQMTNPAWVVLFTKIAGLVTDTGGTTSHPAVLSREFGIPAVVGTSSATHRIATGDRIRVDGSKGVVEILEHSGGPAPSGTTAAEPTSAIGS
jgi:phosphohistidine swiveling domain-containing protein